MNAAELARQARTVFAETSDSQVEALADIIAELADLVAGLGATPAATLYRFHCRAANKDLSGYYHVRWDLATSVVVEAEDREAAFRAVWAVMGTPPGGRCWTAVIDRIEPVSS